MSIRIFTTGGTIDKVYFDARSEFAVGDSLIDRILHEAQVTTPFTIEPLMRKDSLELDDGDRTVMLNAVLEASEAHVIITHGTDTMSVTARTLLDGGVKNHGKTVVLTGALNPARFQGTDAIFNVGMAIAAVQTQEPGVYITMNGQVFEGDRVRKNTTINRFESTYDQLR